MTLKTSLILAAAACLASPCALAGEPTSTREVRASEVRVEANRVVVAGDADSGPQHTVAVFARSIDGGTPSMTVQLVGKDGGEPESFDLAEVAVGETKRFTSDTGREVEITRTEDGVTLAVDGKTIDLPGLGGVPGEGAMAWTAQAGALGEDVDIVMAGEPHVFVAHVPGPVDVENLESVRNLRPEIRDEVVAALREILASPDVLALHGLPAMAGAFAAAPGPGGEQRQHVVVKTIVVDDAKHVQ